MITSTQRTRVITLATPPAGRLKLSEKSAPKILSLKKDCRITAPSRIGTQLVNTSNCTEVGTQLLKYRDQRTRQIDIVV